MDDPKKLELALEQLEAERIRRILEKVQAGTAVFDGEIEILGYPKRNPEPFDPFKPIRIDDKGREVYRGPMPSFDENGRPLPRVLTVITGVPRGGRDEDGIPPERDEQPPAPSFSRRD